MCPTGGAQKSNYIQPRWVGGPAGVCSGPSPLPLRPPIAEASEKARSTLSPEGPPSPTAGGYVGQKSRTPIHLLRPPIPWGVEPTGGLPENFMKREPVPKGPAENREVPPNTIVPQAGRW